MACDGSFLKHYHTPVIHFGILHFKSEETLFYSAGPISPYSHPLCHQSTAGACSHDHGHFVAPEQLSDSGTTLTWCTSREL